MFVYFSDGAGSSAGATCETAAQADKTHLGERIWCIYSTAVKIPEVNEPLPTPSSWWCSISQKRKTGKQTQQTCPAAGPGCSTGQDSTEHGCCSGCDRSPESGNVSLVLRNRCWICSELCPVGSSAWTHRQGMRWSSIPHLREQLQSLLAYTMLMLAPITQH